MMGPDTVWRMQYESSHLTLKIATQASLTNLNFTNNEKVCKVIELVSEGARTQTQLARPRKASSSPHSIPYI